ncbi:hypothetical protein [Microbacterium sp. NPDC055665]
MAVPGPLVTLMVTVPVFKDLMCRKFFIVSVPDESVFAVADFETFPRTAIEIEIESRLTVTGLLASGTPFSVTFTVMVPRSKGAAVDGAVTTTIGLPVCAA